MEKLAVNPPVCNQVYELLANFISSYPHHFAEPDIFKSLRGRLMKSDEKAAILKCLGLIANSDKGKMFADDSDFTLTLASILLNTSTHDELTTYAIITLRSSMLCPSAFNNTSFPWVAIVELLISKSYTKKNALLQASSIQTLRIMSDKKSVKDELRKVYKSKVRGIQCLSKESSKLKDDLLQWLNYKNFKSKDFPLYSNLFI